MRGSPNPSIHTDALGRRVRKVVDDVSDTLDGTTLFFYDGMRVIEEGKLDGQGAYTPTHQYVWGFYLDELLVFDYDAQGDFDLEDTSDQRGHSFQDFIYSTTALMDPDGNVLERCDYEPYGAVTFWTPDYADTRAETEVHLDFLFTGQRYDPETGLYHYKDRTLHAIGRFLQRDMEGNATARNYYEYTSSHPAHRIDPLGNVWYSVQLTRNGGNVSVEFAYPTWGGLWSETGTLALGTYVTLPTGVAGIQTAHGSVSLLFAEWWIRTNAFRWAIGGTPEHDSGLHFEDAWRLFAEKFSASKQCGPDITARLSSVLSMVAFDFQSWTPKQQADACCRVFEPNVDTPVAWDIVELYNMGKGKEFGSAERSVAVDGRCYDSGAVNYALYGKMAKLCNKKLGDVLGTIDAWKREAHETQTDPETRSWCVTAYQGWACSAGRGSCNMGRPFSWTPYAVAADHPTYSGRAFTYTWLPYVWKGEYKEKGFSFLEVYGDR